MATAMEVPTPVQQFLSDTRAEVCRAMSLHAPMRTAHEAYAVILEELDELWEIVRQKRELRDPAAMRAELVQIAAMACRAANDLPGID